MAEYVGICRKMSILVKLRLLRRVVSVFRNFSQSFDLDLGCFSKIKHKLAADSVANVPNCPYLSLFVANWPQKHQCNLILRRMVQALKGRGNLNNIIKLLS
jgi:hypothetical protein